MKVTSDKWGNYTIRASKSEILTLMACITDANSHPNSRKIRDRLDQMEQDFGELLAKYNVVQNIKHGGSDNGN